jgi:Sulfite exporter TauE/SafE.
MIAELYSIIIFIASVLGAAAGLGGGVMIKPMLDLIGYHDLANIVFISTSAGFIMACYTIMKQMHEKVKINWRLVICIAIGSLLGGYIGDKIFTIFLSIFTETIVQTMQTILLITLLLFVLLTTNKTSVYRIQQTNTYIVIIGFILGSVSSFIGIGGGPINMAVLTLLFGIPLKLATVYSIALILFSQGSKLFTIAFATGFSGYDLAILLYCLPIAVLGGIVGSYMNKKLDTISIAMTFQITIIGIITINLLTLFRNII